MFKQARTRTHAAHARSTFGKMVGMTIALIALGAVQPAQSSHDPAEALLVSPPRIAGPLPLKVVDRQLLNSRNEQVRLRGVNTASLEWSSDGERHILNTIAVALQDWHVNVIRLPLAQDRWFGKEPGQRDGGRGYRTLVQQIVEFCASKSCYVVLDLHWSDMGEWGGQIGQHMMPDRNSLEFWKDCAAAYRNHPAVLFDLYNEPFRVTWDIWLNGGKITEVNQRTKAQKMYEAVGMQPLLDAVRQTGAQNVVIAGGLDWAYDMSGFLNGKLLADPNGNGVLYANHYYPNKGDTVEKWVAKMEAVAKQVPIFVGEFGSEGRGQTGGRAGGEKWVRDVLAALQSHDWHWTAWDMHPHAGPRLISNWNYSPTPGFGKWVRESLAEKVLLPQQLSASSQKPAEGEWGILANHADVGTVLHPGGVKYDSAAKTHTITGSGENMWFAKDAFHFAWQKTTGDVSLSADVKFVGEGRERHRKACLMIRQSLDADSAYVDVTIHGDGLTSLQFRDSKGSDTHEVQLNFKAPARLQLVKSGIYAKVFVAREGEAFQFSGAAVRVSMEGSLFVGLGVCSHNKDVSETAIFSNVTLENGITRPTAKPTLFSTLETQSLASTDRKLVFCTPGRLEAPNWLRDGQTLIYNSGGKIFRIPAAGGMPKAIDTGFVNRCNNDHGLSPDGQWLAISDQSQGDRKSRIYMLPVTGGTPKLVTELAPSYWHGWSPDGKTLVYCGERNGEFDIYTIPVAGGAETRLTTAQGLDDGPEYSPDGKHIYFNSNRTGQMHLWRMHADGSDQEQLTDDAFNNWFPHPSPDGKSLVFLSYEKDVVGHPEDKDVILRRMTLADKKITVLGRFLGGQGTVNVPCWSPDGKQIAFVTYQYVP